MLSMPLIQHKIFVAENQSNASLNRYIFKEGLKSEQELMWDCSIFRRYRAWHWKFRFAWFFCKFRRLLNILQWRHRKVIRFADPVYWYYMPLDFVEGRTSTLVDTDTMTLSHVDSGKWASKLWIQFFVELVTSEVFFITSVMSSTFLHSVTILAATFWTLSNGFNGIRAAG